MDIKYSLFWVDMEMTGLDINNDQILEFACILTDDSLKQIKKGPHFIIHASKEKLDGMNEWCTNTHKQSGLYDQALQSKITIEQAEQEVLEFLKNLNIGERQLVLAGNTVHMDKFFMKKYMMKLDNYLHYRIVDVSSFKVMCQKWNQELFDKVPQKQNKHRAFDDIMESIQELEFYKNNFLKN